MLRVRWGTVVRTVLERDGVQVLEVDTSGEQGTALFYINGKDRCHTGDRVLLNTTAVDLKLGTGGVHFVMAREGETDKEGADWHPTKWGHIMKLRYTPWQLAVDAVEEQNSPYHELFKKEDLSLSGTPVILAELHSSLPVICLALRRLHPGARIVYVMPDFAALPLAWSRHVQVLKEIGILDSTVTTGHAWGGEYEAVNLYTGFLTAAHVAKADYIVCIPGPGGAGTGTKLGFSGIQLAEVVHATSYLQGIPVFVPRISLADGRERHFGISHHTKTLLKEIILKPCHVALPFPNEGKHPELERQWEELQTESIHHFHRITLPAPDFLPNLLREYPEPITSMGINIQNEPSGAEAACLAAVLAVRFKTEVSGVSQLPSG